MNTPDSAGSTTPQKLSSLAQLFAQTWGIYKRKLRVLVGLTLIGLGTFLAILLSSVAAAFLSIKLPTPWNTMVPIVPGFFALVAIVCCLYVVARFQLAFIFAIIKESCSVKEAIAASKTRVLSFLWLGVLTGFLLMGAWLLFIVPGFLFTVWFCFGPFVFVTEEVKGMNCLMRSKALVAGKWWPVALRLLAVWVLSNGFLAIPFIGPIIRIFLVPFNVIYATILFQELKAQHPVPAVVPAKSKAAVLGVAFLGYLVVPVLMVLLAFTLLSAVISQFQSKIPGIFPFGSKPSQTMALPSLPDPDVLPDPPEPILTPEPTPPIVVAPAAVMPPSNPPAAAKKKTSLFEKLSTKKSSGATMRITLKNGHTMTGRIEEEDSTGFWFEIEEGVRLYLKREEILEIKEENSA